MSSKIVNLYKINMTHAAPKGNETAIKEFVIAKDDKAVFDYMKDKNRLLLLERPSWR